MASSRTLQCPTRSWPTWVVDGGGGEVRVPSPSNAPLLPPPPVRTHWQAYDLADPWVNCGNAPQTAQCPGCDVADPENSCLQPYYMGPGIHPR